VCVYIEGDYFTNGDLKEISCVHTEDGDVYTWGRGWDGQLGHDVITEIELEPRIVPQMENRASAAVACGRAHTVVVTDNGNVWSWGDNKAGQLGIGSLVSTCTPKLVEALDEQEVTYVVSGLCPHSCTVCLCVYVCVCVCRKSHMC
jgi:alpha-tubulin suppressor-like RCC1 family protein